jgi:hypothetical protein
MSGKWTLLWYLVFNVIVWCGIWLVGGACCRLGGRDAWLVSLGAWLVLGGIFGLQNEVTGYQIYLLRKRIDEMVSVKTGFERTEEDETHGK